MITNFGREVRTALANARDAFDTKDWDTFDATVNDAIVSRYLKAVHESTERGSSAPDDVAALCGLWAHVALLRHYDDAARMTIILERLDDPTLQAFPRQWGAFLRIKRGEVMLALCRLTCATPTPVVLDPENDWRKATTTLDRCGYKQDAAVARLMLARLLLNTWQARPKMALKMCQRAWWPLWGTLRDDMLPFLLASVLWASISLRLLERHALDRLCLKYAGRLARKLNRQQGTTITVGHDSDLDFTLPYTNLLG